MDLSNRIGQALGFLKYIWDRIQKDKCQQTAAALTYQTLFAMVPLITVMYAAISYIATFSDTAATSEMERRIEDFVFSNFIPQTGDVVQEYLKDFSDQARKLTFAGVLFLVVTSFMMLMTIEKSFNEIWEVDRPRKGIQRFLLYWAVLTMGPLAVILGMFVSAYIISLPLISDVAETTRFLQFVPFLLSILVFTLIYVAVPNCSVSIKHGLIGGVLVAGLFEVAKNLFVSIVAKSSFEFIYGAFATVPLFLIWIYLVWIIILAGAEFVKALEFHEDESKNLARSHFERILGVLERFYISFQSGKEVSDADILENTIGIGSEKWNIYKKILLEHNFIKQVEDGGYVLSRDLKQVTIWQFQQYLSWPIPTSTASAAGKWQTKVSHLLEELAQTNQEILKVSLEDVFSGVEDEYEN